ncbi:MAG: DUF4430 domain-containing protein [Bifidobacteriaceae bacterium]|jgi:hypothetical protein|nr:DUF4430 domain-containing protein [Bifidobacteriaceae bacterium]
MRTPLRRIAAFIAGAALSVPLGLAAAETASAEDPKGYVTMSLDLAALGAGVLYEPLKMPFYEGDNWAALTLRFLGADNVQYSGSVSSSFYISDVKLPRDIEVSVPQVIVDEVEDLGDELEDGPSAAGEWLSAFDYYWMSGWMYTINSEMASLGASDIQPQDGDVVRWNFTVYGYGADLGLDVGWGFDALFPAADKSGLVKALGAVNADPGRSALLAKPGAQAAYDAALAALGALQATQAQADQAATALDQAITAVPPPSHVDISAELAATMAYLKTTVPEPVFGSQGGEWVVLSLARSGVELPAGYAAGYYQRIVAEVTDTAKHPKAPQLDNSKSTENSRLILALAALGYDPTDAGGLDLTWPLSDYSFVTRQGINGPVFALIALDTVPLDMPDIGDFNPAADTANQNTRERMVQYLLDKEINRGTSSAGGWALSGSTPDPDMTAMALQALAPHKSDPDVAAAINRAVGALSGLQNAQGGYASWGTVNAESIAQVITALTALGIDPATDARFVKAEGNAVTALLDFFVAGGGFKHTAGGGVNQMATEQGAYALVAYDRFANGLNSLYDMSDAVQATPPPPDAEGDGAITLQGPDEVSGGAGATFNVQVLTDGWPDETYQLFDALINIPAQFEVTNAVASTRLGGGTLSWNVDADNKLRVVYANTALQPIALTGDTWPAELLTISLEVAGAVDPDVTPHADLTVGGATVKAHPDVQFAFDISQAAHRVSFEEIGITVTELFTGDGVDLIPASARAVAVSFSGVDLTGLAPTFKGQGLISSPELTAKRGQPTYVLVTAPATAAADLVAVASYTFPAGAPQAVKFGDTDANGLINAQDATDSISAWLRVKAVASNQDILRHNVTSDARINTFDALAVVANYVSGVDFPIALK